MDLITPSEIRALIRELRADIRSPEDKAAVDAFAALALAWDEAMRPAFEEAADALASAEEGASLAEILAPILADAETLFVVSALGSGFLAAVIGAIQGGGREMAAGLGITYGGPDRRTAVQIRRHETYWITRYGERILEPRIARIVEKAAKNGEGERGAAEALSEALGEEYDRSLRYWRLVSTAATSRAGTLGRIDVLEQAGRDGRLDAADDDRTSDVCKYLDGRTVPLSELLAWRENILSVSSPEDVVQRDPWWQDKDVESGGRLRQLVESFGGNVPRGAGLPGYHPHCRTILVAGPRAAARGSNG